MSELFDISTANGTAARSITQAVASTPAKPAKRKHASDIDDDEILSSAKRTKLTSAEALLEVAEAMKEKQRGKDESAAKRGNAVRMLVRVYQPELSNSQFAKAVTLLSKQQNAEVFLVLGDDHLSQRVWLLETIDSI